MKTRIWIFHLVCLSVLICGSSAQAKNFQLKGDNELCGGIGFAADLTDWTPGGFKWFNDYSRKLSQLTWLNVQLNVTTGGTHGYDCYWDPVRKRTFCDDHRHWGGSALEIAIGVKLKWRVKRIPLQIHAKFGGAVDALFLWSDYKGVAFGFRGGAGVRYFFLPTFGVGAEIIPTFGPAIINNNVGFEMYASLDFNMGVEWRF